MASLPEVLRCVQFPVVAGTAPPVESLDQQTKELTRDWGVAAAPAAGGAAAAAPVGDSSALEHPGLAEDGRVQGTVLKIWDLFEKRADSSIGREEYEAFVRRITRVLIPGLAAKQESQLAANCWAEVAGISECMPFVSFYEELVRFAKTWTDSRSPDVLVVFLEDLLTRISRIRVPSEDGKGEEELPVELSVSFEGQNGNLDWAPLESDFVKAVEIAWNGRPQKFDMSTKIAAKVFAETSSNYCWYKEVAVCALDELAPEDGQRRVWAPLDEIVPMGYAVKAALDQIVKTASEGPLHIDLTDMSPAPDSPLDGVRIMLASKLPSGGSSVSVVVGLDVPEPVALVQDAGHAFAISDLLGAGLSKGNVSKVVIIAPAQGSMLYKLDTVRRNLCLPQPSAFAAATRLGEAGNPTELPTFSGVLRNQLEVEKTSGLVKPVHVETLLESASLATIAEAYLSTHSDINGASSFGADATSLAAASPAGVGRSSKWVPPPKQHLAGFPTPEEGLRNDETDLLTLARTSPIALWVLGKCTASGEYKTEVCRRLADRLGLQWLNPRYLLELAVKTPEKFRTKLMQNCVEQLQRGMAVSVADSLALTLEMMSSSRCKTNGYVLDLPPIGPADAQAVVEFAKRVQGLSTVKEVRWDELFEGDLKELPALKAEPTPPAPPPPEGEEGAEGGEGGEEASAAAGEGEEGAVEAAEGADAEAPAEGGEAGAEGGADGEAAAEEAAPAPKPPAPLVPNPLTNLAPRRLLFVSMECDEIKAWKLSTLKELYAEKERRKEERRAAALAEGGEVEEEEEEEQNAEEPEELPTLPEDGEELQEVFTNGGGDFLQTMTPYIPKPPLHESWNSMALDARKKLPPLPDESRAIQEESEDVQVLKATEDTLTRDLRVKQGVPVLRVHADGRSPETVANLLEVASGGFRGAKLALPKPLEGGADEPKELLRLGLDEKQASRRWSPWRLHCPVSLLDHTLVPGDKEFSAEYRGCTFVFADATKRARFCGGPKPFLEDAPRINAPGMHLGYVLAGPLGYRCRELADKMHEVYGFDVVDVTEVIGKAMEMEPSDQEVPAQDDGEEEGGGEAAQVPAESAERPSTRPYDDDLPRLLFAERQDLLEGRPLKMETLVRLVARALKIGRNVELLAQQRNGIEEAKKAIEAAEAAGEERPAHIVVDEDSGEPVVELAGELTQPERGFVLVNFPETAEELKALREQASLALERVLVFKLLGDEAPEPAEFLAKQQPKERPILAPALEAQLAALEGLAEGADEGLRIEEVPMEAELAEQLVHVRKLIDPFYQVVLDPSVAMEVPDPDEWNEEEAIAAATDDDGNLTEKPERPVVPWGPCGPYCPVTLTNDDWLAPGSKEFQHVYGNRVFAMANEKCSEAFLAEPSRYVPAEREPVPPPPRILVTGPTGSTVARQCELLHDAYRIPVVKLEQEWLKVVGERLEEAKKAKKAKDKKEAEAERVLLNDEGAPEWLPGWLPKEPVEGEEGEEAAEEEEKPEEDPEPEDDGLDDEQRAELFVEAMRTVLGCHRGACIIDGSFFGDLENEEMGDDVKTARSLHNLLVKARRLPDLTVVLKCKNDFAFGNAVDVAAIDKEDEELCELAKAQDAAKILEKLKEAKLISEERKEAFKAFAEELQGTEEDGPPDPLPEASEDLLAPETKESELAKAKFVDKKKLEQEALKELVEKLAEARSAPVKVPVDRGEEPAHKAVRWHCRPFMELRASLFLRHQVTKLSPSRAQDLIDRGLAEPSVFGTFDPMAVDAPLFTGKADALQHIAELRGRLYYPRGQEQLTKFLERPQDFIHLPAPSRVPVHPATAVVGPPLSGKTALAKELARRTGAVYLSIPEVVSDLCHPMCLPSRLARDIMQHLRAGEQVPDIKLVEALRQRILSPDVLQCGWVLDDFPLTEAQARAMDQAGVVPHRIFTIELAEVETFARAKALGEAGTPTDTDFVQQDVALQRQRLDAYNRSSPLVRVFYSLTYDNMRRIDGARSQWAMYDQALAEVAVAVSQRLEYYRRTTNGLAARAHGLCWGPLRTLQSQSAWLRYCPVSLTLGNELVPCTDARFTAEYKHKLYWMYSEEYLRLFLEEPESFLEVPLPESRPALLTVAERPVQQVPPQLESYCPVALVDRKELKKASDFYLVSFMGRVYSCESKEAAEKFIRRPMRYVQRAKLPSKKPALKGEHQASLLAALEKGRKGRGFEPADMLTFMQASVAEQICQALVDSGEKRPLYPGKSARESALLFLAKFLRAKNPINTEMYAGKVRTGLEDFLSDCALPAALGELSKRKEALEAEGSWTSTDQRVFKELCARFDGVFKLPA